MGIWNCLEWRNFQEIYLQNLYHLSVKFLQNLEEIIGSSSWKKKCDLCKNQLNSYEYKKLPRSKME
jgi:hypothetical protein